MSRIIFEPISNLLRFLLFLFAVLLLFSSPSEADEEWESSESRERRSADLSSKLSGRTLNVVTLPMTPYVIVRPGEDGKDSFTGFIPDIIYALSQRLNFNYKFYIVPDGKYGEYDRDNGKWDGMIGECMKTEEGTSEGADVAAAALTVTAAREKVVDFVKPFQNLGFNAVIKRQIPSINIFSFPYIFGIFQPLDPAVWGLVILSAVVVGLFLWLMNLYNPYEWAGRYAVGLAEKEQSEKFNLAGSMWFAFTTLQWQGYERAPRSIASRFLAGIWFIFVAILLVSYTAGIVNHLFWSSMVHRNSPPYSSTGKADYIDFADLVASRDFQIGAQLNSPEYRFIMEVAVGEEYDAVRRVWTTMQDGNQLLSKTAAEGFKRVREQPNYAFLTDSSTAKYEVNQQPCDLQIAGETFGYRAYGFALPNNSAILEELHTGILEMIEEGDIEALEDKWVGGQEQCWNITSIERTFADINTALFVNKPKPIDMTIFWSALVLLIVGVMISLIVVFVEMMYYRQWGRYKSSNQPRGQQLKVNLDDGNI